MPEEPPPPASKNVPPPVPALVVVVAPAPELLVVPAPPLPDVEPVLVVARGLFPVAEHAAMKEAMLKGPTKRNDVMASSSERHGRRVLVPCQLFSIARRRASLGSHNAPRGGMIDGRR
jgi:hypothetical protein